MMEKNEDLITSRHFLDDAMLQLRKLKAQADKAVAQVEGDQLFTALDEESNSIAVIMKHLAGNMRSRWTDFLTSDGEKPSRDRDREFLVEPGEVREALSEAWEDGWKRVLDAVSSLSADDVQKTVRIRGEAHTVLEAISRQMTHYAAHVGQIVLLAKHFAGTRWQTLSIARGKSKEFDVAKSGNAYKTVEGEHDRQASPPRHDRPDAAQAGKEEGAWTHFLAYLRTAPPLPGPQEVLQHYGRTLAAEGMAQPEVQQRIGALLGMMRQRTDAWPLLFDRIYASGAPNVAGAPNALLLASVEGRPPGRALEVAVGHGRNAVALAARGWEVTGIDVSEEGLSAARTAAERAGVRLSLHRQDDESFQFGTAAWDLIAVVYGPVSITAPRYVQRLYEALAPGGLVVVESFASEKDAPRRRPVDIDPKELLQVFAPFRIARFEDFDGVSEWDPQPTRLVRLVAQKPA